MNEATVDPLEFAEKVRRVTGKSLAYLALGRTDDAVEMISELCGLAGDIVARSKMEQEQGGDYDLSTLPAPSPSADLE